MPEAKTDSRAPRDSESREESKRLASYDPGDMLPSPEPRDGIEYRYVTLITLRLNGPDGLL